MKISPNNLDLIRLVAASQVMLNHVIEHTHADAPPWLRLLLDIFPGVPIFFAISGFLIYQSYAKTADLWEYALNRFLRLYPGLIGCFLFSIACVFAVGYLREPPSGFAVWTVAQLTFAQFYNPEFMRGFGVGVLNGSLWTISVELQFYLLTPLVHRYEKRMPWLIGLFVVLNLLYIYGPHEGMAPKFYGVTFLPWFYMFLTGAYLATRQDLLDAIASRPWLLPAYVVVAILGSAFYPFGNMILPPFFGLLAAGVFAAAYFRPDIANRLLHRNDVSYGIYIYHMPVINSLLYLGLQSISIAVAVTLGLAVLSWFTIERPSLRLKHLSMHRV